MRERTRAISGYLLAWLTARARPALQGPLANKFGLLTWQIVSVDDTALTSLIVTGLLVLTVLRVIWRPLMFARVDPDVSVARGVPVAALSSLFMVLLGCAVALSIKIVGALLVLTLLCTPAAAAMRVTASQVLTPLLSVLSATCSLVGGILIALGTSIPISPYVTTISFTIYLACRIASRTGSRRGWVVPEATAEPTAEAAVERCG